MDTNVVLISSTPLSSSLKSSAGSFVAGVVFGFRVVFYLTTIDQHQMIVREKLNKRDVFKVRNVEKVFK
jgi:hypothetical protein